MRNCSFTSFQPESVVNAVKTKIHRGESGWIDDECGKLLCFSFKDDDIRCHGLVSLTDTQDGVFCEILADNDFDRDTVYQQFMELLEETHEGKDTALPARSA